MPGERARSGMSPSSNDTGRADPPGSGSEQRLLNRVRRGSSSAVNALFERYAPWLRRRASGRLPQWARSGVTTSDLVQDVLHHTYARLNWFESKHVSALRAYLRRAVENRVQDEMRRAIRRLDNTRLATGEEPLRPFEDTAPQYQQLLHDEMSLPGGLEAPEGPRSPADRRPCGTGVQLRAARGHRTPAESGRSAQGAQAGCDSAERGHAAVLRKVASISPARPGVRPRRRPILLKPSGSGHADVITE